MAMSDNYKWDGDLYQGKPEGEKKYEYYKVGEQKDGSEEQKADSAAAEQAAASSAAQTENTSYGQNSQNAGVADSTYASGADGNTAGGSADGTSSADSANTQTATGQSSGYQGTAGTGSSYQSTAGAGSSYQSTADQSTGHQGTTGQGNSYQSSSYQGGSYQGSGYRASHQVPPVQSAKTQRAKTRKNGNGNGMGKKFGVTISLALVFGLVAGLVFQGVNVIGSRYLDSGSSSQPQLQSTELVQQTEEASSSGSSSATTVSTNSVAAVAQSVMPSVVAITSVSVQEVQSFFGGVQQYQGVSSGSGVIVGENDEELLIATNNHVVEDAEELSVCFIGDDVVTSEEIQENLQNNGGLNMDGAVSASIKGTDADNDLAVISVKKSDIPEETMSEIKIASIGNSDDLQVGEQVVAIGNALGYGQSVTSGYVSALNRQVTFENNNTASMIQTDAAINPGNSGGALLNMQGQLIGINTAKEASDTVEGMGYSIPINTASPILDDLMTRETREKVDESESAYMGINVADLTDETSEMYNMPQEAFVASVTEGSAAEKAGILQNDIITELDGQTVSGRDDLLNKLEYYKAGETVEIVVSRANAGTYESQTLTITFDSRPADAQ